MGRNSSGTYSAPLAPFVTGTVISSSDVNTKFSDLGTEMTDSLSRSGKGGMSAPLKLHDGSAAAPSLTFTAQPGIGFYRAGDYDLRFVSDAAEKFRLTSAGAKVTGTLEVTGVTTLSGGVAGNTSFDSGVLYVDATNNRVGVNTSAPNVALAVGHAGVADNNVPVQIDAGAAGEAYVGVNKGGALALLLGYSNGGALGTKAIIRNVQNENIGFYINNTTAIANITSQGLHLAVANPSSSTAHTNVLGPTNTPKAWAVLSTDGAGAVSVLDGFNITSVAVNGSGYITVTFASAFASTVYGTFGNMGFGSLYGVTFLNQTTSAVDVKLFNPSTLAAVSAATVSVQVRVFFIGAQ